eukprot:g4351.t1
MVYHGITHLAHSLLCLLTFMHRCFFPHCAYIYLLSTFVYFILSKIANLVLFLGVCVSNGGGGKAGDLQRDAGDLRLVGGRRGSHWPAR